MRSTEPAVRQREFFVAEIVLEVKNLTKHFPISGRKTVYAVDGLDFALRRGSTLGLVGESGCGKSTAARTLIRIYEPTAGEIFWHGKNVTNLSQKELKPLRKQIQMIFQDPYASLNARMTVRDIIAEPLKAHGMAANRRETDDKVFSMLEMVGLGEEHARRYAHEFSGGQRQRIGIARALILRPDIVICDEPISALDVSIQAQVINMLKDFQEEQNLTYLFIAHDLSMVRYVSDDVGVMYLGHLVELSPAEAIYREPLHPYTKGLLASIPVPNPKLAKARAKSELEGDLPSPLEPPPGCRFQTRCKYAMPVCREAKPALSDQGQGRLVACHLYSN
jgi:oligopeptide transport system ATP-binding protein